MKLQRINLENFRNHKFTQLECSPGLNIFLGDNGEGKTNVIEGISYLCLSKSFFAASDKNLVKIGESGFNITGRIKKDNGTEYEVISRYDQTLNKKNIEVNHEKIYKSSSMFGEFPVVILAPDQSSITAGPPVSRRQFADFIISQSSRSYLEKLIEFKRILKQRNRILCDVKSGNNGSDVTIETWNKSLVATGTEIIRKRIGFIPAFKDLLADSYAKIAGKKEIPEIKYCPSFECIDDDKGSIEERFQIALEKTSGLERKLGHTLAGPHRDDFVLLIDERDAIKYASQGQHKTLLVALKLAEFEYLKEKCGETPVLLLDDVLSELDDRRSQLLLETTAGYGQIFISSSNEHALNWLPVASARPRKFYIRNGGIESIKDER